NTTARYCAVATVVFMFLVVPFSALAEDQESIAALRMMGKAFATIAEEASPAVVGLRAERTAAQDSSTYRNWPFDEDLFDFWFRQPSPRERSPQRRYRERPVTAMGSGFIISPDGYILTNNHMVGDAEKVEIELADDRKFTAKIIGTDPVSDVAVVKIDAEDLPYLELGDSDALEVGEWVLAIGNPLSFSHTVTAGIVSAKGRSVGLADIENFIQTDAAINRGNSGGPLIDLDGKVVGINTAIVGATGNIGIGFAIPINMVKHAYKQLREGKSVERGFIGVQLEQLTPGVAASLGLPEETKGVTVSKVVEDSPAEKAGLKPYDVIVEFEGVPVEKSNEFVNRVSMLEPGTRIELVALRDGKRKKFSIKLGTRPAIEELSGDRPTDVFEELGFSVDNLTRDLAERLGYESQSGVLVTEVDPRSQAAEVGLAPGVLIKEVNRRKVSNVREFRQAIDKAKEKGSALLLAQRERSTFLALLRFSED
ncbi:MAG: DegQ family serine endoprotease, partial [Planctomycetota bacterium]